MSKDMKKLIEEIDYIVQDEIYGTSHFEDEHFSRLSDKCRQNVINTWEKVITRIGKAYADGELKMPGWQTIFRQICCWQEDKDGTQILTANAPDNGEYWLLRADDRGAIALRKEEEK